MLKLAVTAFRESLHRTIKDIDVCHRALMCHVWIMREK